MGTIKFVTFTDVHISVVNPASRVGNYEEDILDKLGQIKIAGEKLKVDFFLFGGDLFNLKAPMRNPHALNSKLITLFKSFPAPIYATEGNHDLRNDSYETFEEQPLNVIYSSGALIQTRDIRREINGVRVRLRGFPFNENPDLGAIPSAKDGSSDLNICLLHLYSTARGGDLFKQRLYSYEEIARLGDDVFLLGHYHLDQGIETIKSNGYDQVFVNVGSVSRGSLSDDEVNRTPRIGYVEAAVNNGNVSYTVSALKLKVKPAEEVFDIPKREEEIKQAKDAEVFAAKLQADIETTSDEEDKVKNEAMKLNIEKEVLKRVLDFLQEADLNRKSLEA